MADVEFVNGLMVKAPHPKAPDYVKGSISIKREKLIEWLSSRDNEWVNIDVKESKGGKWYAAVSNYKKGSSGVKGKGKSLDDQIAEANSELEPF